MQLCFFLTKLVFFYLDAYVLNVETINIRLLPGGPHSRGPETTYVTETRDPGAKVTQWLTYIRQET